MATAPKRIPDDTTSPESTNLEPRPTLDDGELRHEHPTPEEIAAEAYAIYVANGSQHGRHEEDWLEAEARLQRRRRPGDPQSL
jgi:hypothetical protein